MQINNRSVWLLASFFMLTQAFMATAGLCALEPLGGEAAPVRPHLDNSRPDRPSLRQGAPGTASAEEDRLRAQALETLRRAATFFRTHVAVEGGYVRRHSEDLRHREGGDINLWKGEPVPSVSALSIEVQPPGTPTVGDACLDAYEATGDAYYLEIARDAGHALAKGQLRSGGWDYMIHFYPAVRARYAYRVDPPENAEGAFNRTTLDDGVTQSALQFLMRLDQTFQFKDEKIHEAVRCALDALLEAQYPSGGWPQRYERFPDPSLYPIKRGSYPETWPQTWPHENYFDYYTFNDDAITGVVDVLLEAAQLYGDAKYQHAAEKAGDFILLAQMPEPQPAWAQQYNAGMHPAWARKFEPPGISGAESQGILMLLLRLYRETGEPKYLESVPRALAYLRRSVLPDGRLARHYELKTNQPLYFTKDYKLTYRDDDLPTHYAFKVTNKIEEIARNYERARRMPPARPAPVPVPPVTHATRKLIGEVETAIATLDERGRWVEEGRFKSDGRDGPLRRVIESKTFAKNVKTLSAYISATRHSTPSP